jgi:capsular polysaccharide biosynthesis protein
MTNPKNKKLAASQLKAVASEELAAEVKAELEDQAADKPLASFLPVQSDDDTESDE